MYNQIFFTNILRLLDERNISKEQLAEKSGVSLSFIWDLTNGKGNPSLRIMEQLADALDEALPAMLEETDLDSGSLRVLAGGKYDKLPEGYSRVSVTLPNYRAFIVRKWGHEAKQRMLNAKQDNPHDENI